MLQTTPWMSFPTGFCQHPEAVDGSGSWKPKSGKKLTLPRKRQWQDVSLHGGWWLMSASVVLFVQDSTSSCASSLA